MNFDREVYKKSNTILGILAIVIIGIPATDDHHAQTARKEETIIHGFLLELKPADVRPCPGRRHQLADLGHVTADVKRYSTNVVQRVGLDANLSMKQDRVLADYGKLWKTKAFADERAA